MKPSDIEAAILLQNATPLGDFCGLSPNEVHHLLYDTFGEKSPLRLHNHIEDALLDRIPFFRLTEEFLRIIARNSSITLTATGALPRKIVEELYGRQFIPDDMVEAGITKLSRENDFTALVSAHANMQIARLIKVTKGKLTLTNAGRELLAANRRQELFQKTLETFTGKFNWASNDGFPQAPIIQAGWGYTLYLLSKFGYKEQTLQFYADKFLQAFPKALQLFPTVEYSTPHRLFASCYRVRQFERFLDWYGFTKIRGFKDFASQEKDEVGHTDLVEKIFFFDFP